MFKPNLDEVRALSKNYKTIPISRTLYADIRTPIEVLRILKGISRHCFLLESLEDTSRWGRYTFLGYDPQLEITCTDGHLCLDAGTKITLQTDDPGSYLNQIIEENR